MGDSNLDSNLLASSESDSSERVSVANDRDADIESQWEKLARTAPHCELAGGQLARDCLEPADLEKSYILSLSPVRR